MSSKSGEKKFEIKIYKIYKSNEFHLRNTNLYITLICHKIFQQSYQY